MINGLDLDAIKLRYCQATPGQWRHGNDGQSIVTDGEDPAPPHYGGRVVCETIGQLDAKWIIAARADVPALVVEIERQRELADFARLLGPARMVLDRCAELSGPAVQAEAADMAQRIVDLIGHPVTDEPPHALVERDRLRDEVERLREELRRAESDRDAWQARAERLAERLQQRSDASS